jgi:hypothetical protein
VRYTFHGKVVNFNCSKSFYSELLKALKETLFVPVKWFLLIIFCRQLQQYSYSTKKEYVVIENKQLIRFISVTRFHSFFQFYSSSLSCMNSVKIWIICSIEILPFFFGLISSQVLDVAFEALSRCRHSCLAEWSDPKEKKKIPALFNRRRVTLQNNSRNQRKLGGRIHQTRNWTLTISFVILYFLKLLQIKRLNRTGKAWTYHIWIVTILVLKYNNKFKWL